MSEIERIEATQDLVGSFSVLLDEFTACWGGLRVANDQLRTALLDDLIESPSARATLAEWIEDRVAGEDAHLLAPLLSLLWTSGGSVPGTLRTFDASLASPAPIGAMHLAEALSKAFEAHRSRHTVGGPTLDGSATELLIATAIADHRFGLSTEDDEAVGRAIGALLIASFDRDYGAYGIGGVDEAGVALATLTRTRGWRHNAIDGFVEMVALPGITIRQFMLVPLIPPHISTIVRTAREIDQLTALRSRLGPGLVAAWDSFAHTFGEAGEVRASPLIDAEDDPFRAPGGLREDLGPEARHLLDEGSWFPGLFSGESAVPLLSGGVRALLAGRPLDSISRSDDTYVDAALADARGLLERLAANIGESGPAHLATLTAKAEELDVAGGLQEHPELAGYLIQVASGLVVAAEEAAAFAEHLDEAAGERVGDLHLGLRLAVIVAWLDGVARWVVSDAYATSPGVDVERSATPPAGYRAPRKVIKELVASLPDQYTIEEFQFVLDQREAQWDELATLDDGGIPDLESDNSEVVDFEGFADR